MSATILSVKANQSQSSGDVYQEEGLLDAAGSVDFIIPDKVKDVTVQIVPAGGASGNVLATIDSVEKIEAGTAVFKAWDIGATTSTSQAPCLGVITGLRITQTNNGSVAYSICAK
jgi:hypothetical protein